MNKKRNTNTKINNNTKINSNTKTNKNLNKIKIDQEKEVKFVNLIINNIKVNEFKEKIKSQNIKIKQQQNEINELNKIIENFNENDISIILKENIALKKKLVIFENKLENFFNIKESLIYIKTIYNNFSDQNDKIIENIKNDFSNLNDNDNIKIELLDKFYNILTEILNFNLGIKDFKKDFDNLTNDLHEEIKTNFNINYKNSKGNKIHKENLLNSHIYEVDNIINKKLIDNKNFNKEEIDIIFLLKTNLLNRRLKTNFIDLKKTNEIIINYYKKEIEYEKLDYNEEDINFGKYLNLINNLLKNKIKLKDFEFKDLIDFFGFMINYKNYMNIQNIKNLKGNYINFINYFKEKNNLLEKQIINQIKEFFNFFDDKYHNKFEIIYNDMKLKLLNNIDIYLEKIYIEKDALLIDNKLNEWFNIKY